MADRRWWMLLLLTMAMLLTLGASYWRIYPPYPQENERFGVGGNAGSYDPADMEALGASWYVTWGIHGSPSHPNGMAFIQTIPLNQCQLSSWLDRDRVRTIIQTNPASVWQVGNEPDSIYMANCTPEQYAKIYHDFHRLIKSEDPTAKVAFGGLVQATPLRILYLDQVWQAYQDLYNETMPVDVWPLHNYILNEQDCDTNPDNCWGAEIPPGMEAYRHLATVYEIRDHDDMSIFTERIERFRQWMADHGQRDKPLLVNEYGILMWPEIVDENGDDFSDDRVIEFMYATFDYFRTATDASTGYPADDNRLVQAWAWYGLDDDVYHEGQKIGEGYAGDLFTGAYTKTITSLGQAYADYVHEQVGIGPDYTDLWPLRYEMEPSMVFWGETEGVTLTVEVANYGRQPAQDVTVRFWQGDEELIDEQVIPQVPGRYEGTREVSLLWPLPAGGSTAIAGVYKLGVTIDPDDVIVESDDGNNRVSRKILIATNRIFLPVVVHGG